MDLGRFGLSQGARGGNPRAAAGARQERDRSAPLRDWRRRNRARACGQGRGNEGEQAAMPCAEGREEGGRSSGTRACWQLLRERLVRVPIIVTQPDIALLRRAASAFFGVPIDSALLRLFPPSYVPPRYASCAVVGSAGHLVGSGLGAKIDDAQVVLRFNEAPTAGFEEHVGAQSEVACMHLGLDFVSKLSRRARAFSPWPCLPSPSSMACTGRLQDNAPHCTRFAAHPRLHRPSLDGQSRARASMCDDIARPSSSCRPVPLAFPTSCLSPRPLTWPLALPRSWPLPPFSTPTRAALLLFSGLPTLWSSHAAPFCTDIYPSGTADLNDLRRLLEHNGGSGVYLLSAAFRAHAWRLVSTRGPDKTPTSGFIGTSTYLIPRNVRSWTPQKCLRYGVRWSLAFADKEPPTFALQEPLVIPEAAQMHHVLAPSVGWRQRALTALGQGCY